MMTFDREFARLLLEICRYTYAAGFNDNVNAPDKVDALSWIKKFSGLVDEVPIILNGSETSIACIASYPDKNIVAYMGTKTQFNTFENAIESIEDWSENFKTLLVPFEMSGEQLGIDQPLKLGGLVHKGFLEQLKEVQGEVVKELLKIERGGKSRPVFVTGHSQGGAEAALATSALLAGGFPVVSTYTFAAPRPGNLEFFQSIPTTLPVHRIEFGDDIVPHVPPTMVSKEIRVIVDGLKALPFLTKDAINLLDFVLKTDNQYSFSSIGKLCYGSNKTKSFQVDMSTEQEVALFNDRLWSLIRHPEHWAEHHHLAGTTEDIQQNIKGNYTALVSEFQIVDRAAL
jgi:triacylglycerol lipase